MVELPKGPRARTSTVAALAPHRMLVCMPCTHKGQACAPGVALLTKLRTAIALAGPDDGFELSGTASLSDCLTADGKPCVVGWRATPSANWLFGDIDPDQPLDDLVAFAAVSPLADFDDTIGPRISPRLPARTPAAMIVTREGSLQ